MAYPSFAPLRVALVATIASLGLPAATIAQDASGTGMTLEQRYEAAEALRRGEDGPADPTAALAMHRDLVEDGYDRSLVRMGLVYETLGQPGRAIETYERAIEATDSDYARLRLFEGHTSGAFGPLSRPEWGFEQLEDLSETYGSTLAERYLARAYEEGQGTEADIGRAIEIYRRIAEEGDSSALSRLGAIFAEGEGVARDPEAAIRYYREAVDAGRERALIGLAEAQIEAGRPDEARATIDRAVELGVRGAELRRATLHLDEEFGAQSDKPFGARELKRLAEAGDVRAARTALIRHERRSRRIDDLDLETVLAHLQDATEGGDRLATITLARAYRNLSWLIPQPRARLAALVETYGSQMGTREAAERVQVLYDVNTHAASRREAHVFLTSTQGEAFARGLMRLRSIERTSFVYALQHELNDLGYGPCRTTGRMDRCSLKQVLAFCSAAGIYDICKHGPLNYSASRDIADALAAARSGRS